jgi:SAM-dependent methyltransferase
VKLTTIPLRTCNFITRKLKRCTEIIESKRVVLVQNEHDADADYWNTYLGDATLVLDPNTIVDGKTAKERHIGSYIEDEIKTATLLDLGCGFGRMNVFFDIKNYYGCDISPNMISNAERLNKDKSNAFFVLGNGYDLHNFKDSKFDYVICSAVMLHLKVATVKKYAKEIFRVLKSGGSFVVAFPHDSKINVTKIFNQFKVTVLDDKYFQTSTVYRMVKNE